MSRPQSCNRSLALRRESDDSNKKTGAAVGPAVLSAVISS
jgi:hypothetical protein